MERSPGLLLVILAAALWLSPGQAARMVANGGANPIRKVVTMLQSMQKKVEKEGEEEAKLFEKFECYCKKGTSNLEASIAAAEQMVPVITSDLKAAESKLEETKESLKEAQDDRSAAKAAMEEATAIREKEAAAYAKERGQSESNIAATKQAISSLGKGVAAGFLQTSAAQVLRRLVTGKQDMLDVDRQELVSFLSGGVQAEGDAPESGEITGILSQLEETMAKNLAEATATETASVKDYEGLMAAKKKEVAALTVSIEAKTQQIGELGVRIVHMQEDLSDTQSGLAEDRKFAADLKKSCATKKAEWEERSKTRGQELVALADTIKVLGDDEALDIFAKTLPGSAASFLQLGPTMSSVRSEAVTEIRRARKAAGAGARARLGFLVLALSGKKALTQGGFEKVVAMCDSMIDVLKKEGSQDEEKKEYCIQRLDATDDKKKSLERTISDEDHNVETTEQDIAALVQEITTLETGIKALDKSVAEATEQRKQEHASFEAARAADSTAKELLGFAKNRLYKFYNNKLYKPAAKVELSAEDRIYSNMGGELTTLPPGGIADTGIGAFVQLSAQTDHEGSLPAPPETWGAYTAKSKQNQGVIAMIDILISDLDKEMTVAETEEKDSQADYEEMMRDSAAKRVTDSHLLSEKASTKADLESTLDAHKEAKASATANLKATEKYAMSLHAECDWLLKFFDARKEAREGEIDSLTKAKAVLSGADYSFLQTRAVTLRRRVV